MRKVCLVGAGFIAHAHAEVVRALPGLRLHGVVDPDQAAAEALARRWGVDRVFASADAALASGEVDCVHVLTPPDHHAAAATPFLMAGVPTLLEKPLAVNMAQCEALRLAAEDGGAVLGVNQNFVHHPAFVRLRKAIAAREIGRPSSVACVYNVALRQLATGAFGHWMFAEPGNILLEQAVHPLSQIVALAGRVGEMQAMAGPPREISPGMPFYPTINLTLRCEAMPATLRMAVGQSFPFWQIAVIGDDGVAVADILNNRFFTYKRTVWLEMVDGFLSACATGGGVLRDGGRNLIDGLLSTAKVKGRTDGFYQSIHGAVAAFHQALDDKRTPELDGAFGAHLVDVCVRAADAAFTVKPTPAPLRAEGGFAESDYAESDYAGGDYAGGDYDVAVLGGTGFIGAHVVKRLLADDMRVGVMARNVRNLGAVFSDPRVTVIRGDVRVREDVERGVGAAKLVINLAHGGGGKNFEEVRAAMVGGAETVARVCLARGVERLVHVGSIAALYLGPQDGTITGATPPDPKRELRADYARAKADCDVMLTDMHKNQGLPVCLLRPGVVVGEGGIANHSALGFFNNDQHCVGWNRGSNPLPFVLVEDVADAVWRACRAPTAVGRCYNLVGDVRLTAREYVAELAAAQQRPLRFHPKYPTELWLEDMAKWVIKKAVGRKVAMPARYDILSRGLNAVFDCGDAKRALDWRPVADRARFIERGVRVHAVA
jgi:predicted dehydrogenase/nucleoside-diphosphate-sugar epimerase